MTTQISRGALADDAVVKARPARSDGDTVLMSGWMWRCWQALLADPRLGAVADLITIVQGPWMSRLGGGADDSAGYHDEGGCIDIRTWNLTSAQLALFILVASEYGFQFWRRDAEHGGMSPHAHGVFGSDYSLSPGAAEQMRELRETPRGDGLAGSYGRDYEHRVTPIRDRPTNDLLEEDYMASNEAAQKLDQILRQSQATRKLVKALADQVDNLADSVAASASVSEDIKTRITKAKRELAALIKEEDE